MKRLLVVPVIILLALVGYIFFIYDPNPPKKSTTQAAVESLEAGSGDSTGSEAATAADAVEFKVVPVTLPPQEQPTETAADDEEQDDLAANAAELAADVIAADSGMDNPDSAQMQRDDAAGEITPDSTESAVAAGISAVMESAETADADAESTAAGSTPEDQGVAAAEDALEAEAASAAASDEWQSLAAVDDAATSPSALDDTPAEAEDASVDEELNPADFIEHKIVIHSSLYQATSDAGLTANQTARVQKIFKPHLDTRRELRDGDMLTVYLDPGASKASNDADQIHRLEFRGAKKTLIVTRRDDSMSDYEVRDGDGAMLGQEVSQASLITAEPRATAPSGEMQRIEAVVNVSFFSAAREAGLTPRQIDRLREIMSPHIDFTREVRKGDRIVVLLDDNGEVYSCEYIGAVKQLQVTRSSSGDYRVTDLAGRELSIAQSGGDDASREQQPPARPAAERQVAAAGPPENAPAGRRDEPQKAAAAKPTVAAAKGAAAAAKTAAAKPQPKLAGAIADSSDSAASSKGTFWDRLSFGSSKAGPDWRPSDRNLAKVFDKVAATGVIERKALRQAFRYYENNRKSSRLAQTHIAIADYTKKATTERLHIINLSTAKITSVQVAHGRNSGPIGGRVTSTSNANGSNKTTKGFYKVGVKEGRTSSKGYPYLPVQGLEPHNRLVGLPPSKGGRDIIIHTAEYVASGGRSLGCFSIRPEDKQVVFNKLKGVLFYSYVG